jgi:hypothetical protein
VRGKVWKMLSADLKFAKPIRKNDQIH